MRNQSAKCLLVSEVHAELYGSYGDYNSGCQNLEVNNLTSMWGRRKSRGSTWKLPSKVIPKEARHSATNPLIFSHGFRTFGFSWMKRRTATTRAGKKQILKLKNINNVPRLRQKSKTIICKRRKKKDPLKTFSETRSCYAAQAGLETQYIAQACQELSM